MSLSVFNPCSCCLLAFYLVFCHCFRAMSPVGIFTLTGPLPRGSPNETGYKHDVHA